MKTKKDITNEFNKSNEEIFMELDRLNKDMFESNQKNLDDAFAAYRDYKMSLNFN